MLVVISPAKNLDFESPVPSSKNTKAALLEHSSELMIGLKSLAPHDVSALMKISDKLGTLNYDRFQQWALPFNRSNARQAAFAFNGDVYTGLGAYSLDESELAFAQQHLRILSGLYGVLKPLDLIQAYRLEMGTKFANARGADLYSFWGELISQNLNKQLKSLQSDVLVNLASNEYFKAVKPRNLKAEIVTPVFKDMKNGQLKIISFFAKKARGRMCAYIIKNRIEDVQAIKHFDWDGYAYNEALSTDKDWVFTRDQAA